jgi:hypothetical protein
MLNTNAAYTVEFGNKTPAISYVFTFFSIKWHLSYVKIIRKIQGILFNKNQFSLLTIKKKYTRMMSNPSPETPPFRSFIGLFE